MANTSIITMDCDAGIKAGDWLMSGAFRLNKQSTGTTAVMGRAYSDEKNGKVGVITNGTLLADWDSLNYPPISWLQPGAPCAMSQYTDQMVGPGPSGIMGWIVEILDLSDPNVGKVRIYFETAGVP